MGTDGPCSRVSEETGSVLEDIPGTGGEETAAETTVHFTQRTPQEILKDIAEDWLETLDKDEIKSISLFLSYHFMHAFSFTETKAAECAASMVKKSDRTVRRWRRILINNDGSSSRIGARALPTKRCSLAKRGTEQETRRLC